jgi:hypothetical protein
MKPIKLRGRAAIIAATLLFATACTTAMVMSDRAADKPADKPKGPEIVFGEGHFARDNKAFHYWDKEKEIPAVCARCHSARTRAKSCGFAAAPACIERRSRSQS